MCCKEFAEKLSQKFNLSHLLTPLKKSFVHNFWNSELECLYDVIGPPDNPSIRPNQLLAIALPHTMLPKNKAKLVLRKITEELLTPMACELFPQKIGNIKGVMRVLRSKGIEHIIRDAYGHG